MGRLSYFEQITARLDHYDMVSSLRKKRNKLAKEMNVITGNLSKVEFAIKQEAQEIKRSNKDLNKVLITSEQIEFLRQLADKDEYFSELANCYEQELNEVETELNNLEDEVLEVAC
jgi:DNA repair exonuclease SbcCD ATPase subunit